MRLVLPASFVLALVAGSGAWAMPIPHVGPDIRLSKDGRILAHASETHKAKSQNIQIVESEECAFKRVSDTELRLGEKCEYLSGMYRYLFDRKGVAGKRQMVVGFSVRRSAQSHVFLVSSPLELIASHKTSTDQD